jgi:putative ABC transport system permease protein
LNTLWNKIWADLWQAKGRSLLAILSITIGVFCVGTLFGMIDLQLSKMDAAHRESKPSHINLILRSDADLTLLPAIKSIPGVSGIDRLTPLTVRYKLRDNPEWQMGTLIIRPETSTQHYDITTLSSGNWPTNDHIAVEHLSAKYSGLQAGDSVQFEVLGSIKAVPISGVVRHPFVKPPSFGGQVNFFGSKELASQFGIKRNTFRQILVQITSPYSTDKAREVAKLIRTLLNEHHIDVNVTLLQDPKKHWGRPFFAGINNILQLMALASLALASVLIFNTVSAHITQQTSQIGIMKSLGAGIGTVAKVYLIETLFVAVFAVVCAIPLSLATAHLSSCKLLALFNIECNHFSYSPRAIYFMILGGLFAPLLAALIPILRGATMNVREAIASYGLAGDFGRNRFDCWVERFGARFLSTLYASALGNLFRRKGRLLLTQNVLIIAGVMFLVLMSLIASVNLTLDNEMARSRYSVRLGFSQDQPLQKIVELAKSSTKTQQVELWQRHPIEITRNGTVLHPKGSLGIQMLAVPAINSFYQPLIETGRWLQATDARQRVIVLNAETAKLNGINVGDNVEIQLGSTNQTWQVIGLYRWLVGNNYAVEPLYAPFETVEPISHGKSFASFALLNAPEVTTLIEEADYLHQLKQIFQDNNIQLDVYTTIAKLEQRQFARNQFKPVVGTLSGLAALIAVVGSIGLSGTIAIGILQRTREIGVLRAIGAPSKAIFWLFLLEGILHGITAWLVSAPIAYLVARPIAQQLGKTMFGIQLDFAFNVMALGYWLGAVILLAWAASVLPARNATKLTVRECLGY